MVDPATKKKIEDKLRQLRESGASEEYIDQFKSQVSETLKKKVETTPTTEPKTDSEQSSESEQPSGSGSQQTSFDNEMSVQEALDQGVDPNMSVLDAQKASEEAPTKPEMGLEDFKKVAVENAQVSTKNQLLKDPQFVTQAKKLRDEAISEVRDEVLVEIEEKGLSDDAANELFTERVNESFQEKIQSDDKIAKLDQKYNKIQSERASNNLQTMLDEEAKRRQEDRLPFMQRLFNMGSFGQGLVETIESTIPREFKAVELATESDNMDFLRRAIEQTDNPGKIAAIEKKIQDGENVSDDEMMDLRASYKHRGESREDMQQKLQETMGITQELLDEIDVLDVGSAASDLNRNLLDVEDMGELATTLGALVGDQVARIPAMLVGGGFVAEWGNIYMDNINAIAEKENITPLEVIQQGKDEKAVAGVAGAISGSLDYIGLGKVVNFIKNAATKNIRKQAIGLLGTGIVEGTTEGAQNLVAQQATNEVTGESGFDYTAAANEALAGSSMGLLFAAPGLRSSSKTYLLNDQNITRNQAKSLIEAGDVDGLSIQNDRVLQEKLNEVNESNATTQEESAAEEGTVEGPEVAEDVPGSQRATEEGATAQEDTDRSDADNDIPQLTEEQSSQIKEGAKVTFVPTKDISEKKVSLGSVFETDDTNEVSASNVQNILKERYKNFKKLNKCINA